jgi:hypothetical protein
MQRLMKHVHLPTGAAAVIATCLALAATAVNAAPPPPFAARDGLDLAREAARSWAADAELVYVENDEPLQVDGSAARWGYLFRSRAADAARGYSVRDGRIVVAADLGFDFEAPPIAGGWIDSGAALAAAEVAAADYCRQHGGRLASMLLIRGAFNEQHPDGTTWTVVYTSDTAPSLLVVVDAARGGVVRTLKG